MPTFGGIVVATGGSEGDDRRTLLDVVDELARPINASDETVRALAGDAFRQAVRAYNRKGLWPWEIQDEDLTQTVGSPNTTVSGYVKKPLAMYYLDSSNLPFERIRYQEYESLVNEYDIAYSSRPYVYSIGNLFETGQIRWSSLPVSAEACRFTYYRATPAPRTEAEAVEVPEYAIGAYMAEAQFQLALRLPAMQARFPLTIAKAEALQAFKELSAHVNAPGDRAQYG